MKSTVVGLKRTKYSNPHFLALFVLLVIGATACARLDGKKVPIDSLLHLERGISQQEVEEIFGTPARHQFSTKIDGKSLRCVSFSFDSRGCYYFVFTNDFLGKICAPPPFEFRRVPYKNTWAEFPDRSDPEKRMKKVLDSPDLVAAALSDSLQQQQSPPKSGSMNVLPAFIITAPVWAAAAPLHAKQRTEINLLAKQFDPQKVSLGMTIKDVEEMFGKPHLSEASEEQREIRYYGSARLGADNLLWVSVVFEDGRAIRVFSSDFFDIQKIIMQ